MPQYSIRPQSPPPAIIFIRITGIIEQKDSHSKPKMTSNSHLTSDFSIQVETQEKCINKIKFIFQDNSYVHFENKHNIIN